jgi:serine/threonine protein kinase
VLLANRKGSSNFQLSATVMPRPSVETAKHPIHVDKAEDNNALILSLLGVGSVIAGYAAFKYYWRGAQAESRGSAHLSNQQPSPKLAGVNEHGHMPTAASATPTNPANLTKALAVFASLESSIRAQYVCLGWLGSGLTSNVILAKAVHSVDGQIAGQTVALKIVSKDAFPADSDDQHLLELVRQETRILCDMQHPHVIKVLRWLETKEHIIIAMEHVVGG